MSKTISLTILCSFFLLAVLLVSFAQVRHETATVRIVWLDRNGNDAGNVGVKSFRNEDGAEFRSRFYANVATKIPLGIYDLVVDEPEFLPIRRRVDVVEPDVWVVVSLDYGDGDSVGYGPNFTVKGTVKNFNRADEPIYIRLVGIYTGYIGDTKLQISGNQGTFTLSGEEPRGRYVLITTGRRGVLDTRPVDLKDAPLAPIEIDVGRIPAASN